MKSWHRFDVVTTRWSRLNSGNSLPQVVVHVTDVNDNAPVFTSRVYSRKMTEGVEVETIVATVTARDIDAGQNGAVRYEILDGNQGGEWAINRRVQLNPFTPELPLLS